MDYLSEFSKLFRGRSDVYGRYTPKPKKGNKEKGQAWTERGQINPSHYEDHLKGGVGLGIVPIMKNDKCYWGAIDIDDYDLDLNYIVKRIPKEILLCRSKSGGAHLFVFFKNPIRASTLKEKLQEIAMSLGYPSAEVFPKQEQTDDIGSWINLPYYESERTVRYCIRNGDSLTLEEFVKLAEASKLTKKDFLKIEAVLPEAFNDGPPCLQYLALIKIGEGQKDLGLFNMAVYCKQKFGDEWEKNLEEMNQTHVNPPAKSSTMIQVLKPHKKKDYFYKCKEKPIINYCNKDLCRKREFGIGGDSKELELITGRLIKMDTKPPIWYLDVEGLSIEFQTDDLISQNKFRKVCFECIHKIPGRIKDFDWDKFLQEKLDSVEIVKAPEDAGMAGQFNFLLKTYCTERAMAMTKQEILQDKPFFDNEENKYYFRSASLLAFMKNQNLNLSPSRAFAQIKALKGGTKVMKIKGKSERTWWIPEYEDKQDEPFDVPNMDEEPF